MVMTTLLSQIKQMWNYLIRPPMTNTTMKRGQQAFLLTALSFALLLAACITFPIWVLASPRLTTAPYIALITTGLLLCVYMLSRTRHYFVSSLILIATSFILVIAVLLTTLDPIVKIPAYHFLLIGVLLSSMLLTVRTTLIVAATSLVLTAVFLLVPGVEFNSSFPVFVFMAVMSALIILDMNIRNRSLGQLTEAQAQYQGLFNQTHDAVIIIDLHGNYVQANRRTAEMLGYSIEELQQLKVSDVSEELPENQMRHERLMAGEHIPVYERRFRKKDGSYLIGEVNVELVRDADGHPHHIQSVVRDIAERKHNEELLQRQNKYLTVLHRVTVDLLNHRNRDDLLQSIISHVSEMIDAPYVEIMIKEGDELVTRASTPNIAFVLGDRPKHDEASLAWKAHDTRQVVTIDDYSTYPLRRPIYDNTPTSALACFPIIVGQDCLGVFELSRSQQNQPFTPEELQQGTLFAQLVALLLDNASLHDSAAYEIAQRKQIEANLRTIQERQQALLSAIPDLIFRFDKNGTYLDYHATDLNNLTVPPEQFLGRNIRDVMPADIAALQTDHMKQVLQTGQPTVFEYSMSLTDIGTPNYFEARMVVSRQDEVLAIVRDITMRKILEEQLFNLVEESARADVLHQFVENVSHELRTPLSTITSALYLITKTDDQAKRQHYADRATYHVGQLSRLLDTTLSMTKLDNNLLRNNQAVNLNDWGHRVVNAAQDRLAQKGLSIAFNPDSDLPMIMGDAVLLQEVLGNLLDNAIRFTPEEGDIAIRTYSQEGYAVIEFKDTGIGISDEALPHIFERFWRQDQSHSTPGFGLGLSIALKIAEMHDGRIEVESQLGKGSTFKVLLPIGTTEVRE